MFEFLAFLIVLVCVVAAGAVGGPSLITAARKQLLKMQEEALALPQDQARREELKELLHREEAAKQKGRTLIVEAMSEQIQRAIDTGRDKGEIDFSALRNILTQNALPAGRDRQ